MDIFFEPHRVTLKALLAHKVEFLMIGGYAVNYYGYNRPTGDMDLWLNPVEENKNRFLQLLRGEGFEDEGIAHVQSLDFSKASAFHIGEVPFRIDFLTRINGVGYDEANRKKVVADIDGLPVPVIHFDDLILSKISSERLKDRADVEELQKVKNINRKASE